MSPATTQKKKTAAKKVVTKKRTLTDPRTVLKPRTSLRIMRDEKKVLQTLPEFEKTVRNLRNYGASLSELQRVVMAAYRSR